MKRKITILAVLGILMLIVAGVLMNKANQKQREVDQMLEIQLALQGIDPKGSSQNPVKVILVIGDCATDENPFADGVTMYTGLTAVKYCANPEGDFHQRLEGTCLKKGLRQRNNALGQYDKEITKKDFIELACGIANNYPEKTEAWDDQDLNDGLESLIGDYLSTN